MQERKCFFFLTQKLDVWLTNIWESLCPDLNIQICLPYLLRCVPKGPISRGIFPSHFYELQVVNPGPEEPI